MHCTVAVVIALRVRAHQCLLNHLKTSLSSLHHHCSTECITVTSSDVSCATSSQSTDLLPPSSYVLLAIPSLL